MKKLLNPLFYVFVILLAGCQINETVETVSHDSKYTITISPAETLIWPSTTTMTLPNTLLPTPNVTARENPTLMETGTPMPTNKPLILPEARLQIQCIEVEPNLPSNSVANGRVILASRVVTDGRYNREWFLLDMVTGKVTRMNGENDDGIEFSVSPDRKLLTYKNNIFDATNTIIQRELVVASADGQRLKTIPWEEGWVGLSGWLDNQRVVIDISGLDPAESTAQKAISLLVLNPFNGERQILQPDFPQIYDYYPVPDWDMWGITMYDPTLTRVVYLRINKGQYEYALWDMQKQQLLASLVYDSQIPRWSPDGSRVVVDGLPGGLEYNPGEPNNFETFLISKDGYVEQLTYLSTYTDMSLMSYSWSPDGRYLAAWLGSPSLAKSKEVELAILDTRTGQVTDYCVRVKYGGEDYGLGGFPRAPLWSPDGKQLIVQDFYEGGPRRVILVDWVQGFAVQIAEDMEAFGWLASIP